MNRKNRGGICGLTNMQGPFVKSHLIPRALTRLSRTGQKHIEVGIGHGQKTRADSWYDENLVTRIGEDILSVIDTKGIIELRKHRLVWSSWGDADQIQESQPLANDASFRILVLDNPDNLRVFFLSLLWRAAATKRPEFDDINLQDDDLEDLKSRVFRQDSGQPEDYPIHLFQLITRGPNHNRTPLLERKLVPSADGRTELEIHYVRFYFDGLVSHIHLARREKLSPDYLKTCIGFTENTIVFAHKFDSSRTNDNINEMAETVTRESLEFSNPSKPLKPLIAGIREAWLDVSAATQFGTNRS